MSISQLDPLRQAYWRWRSQARRRTLCFYELPSEMPRLQAPRLAFGQLTPASLAASQSEGRFDHALIWHQEPATCPFGHVDEAGRVQSLLWVTRGGTHSHAPFEMGLKLAIPEGAYYVWDCQTATSARNHGLFTDGLARMRELQDGRRGLVYAASDNLPSRRAIERVGGRLSARIELRRFGPMIRIKNADAVRWALTGASIAAGDFAPPTLGGGYANGRG
jgi:hypothetical protein